VERTPHVSGAAQLWKECVTRDCAKA